MIVLLPTAKKMTEKEGQGVPFKNIKEKTRKIVEIMNGKTVQEIKDIFKITEEKAKAEKKNFELILSGKSETYPAIIYFDGLMYKNIEMENMEENQKKEISENVYITSSLYGIVESFERVSRHRLDFNQKIQDLNLYEYWKEEYDSFLEEKIEKSEIVLSLLSNEFEKVFSKDLRKKMIKVKFLKNGKAQSTSSKMLRGKILKYIAKENLLQTNELEYIIEKLEKFKEGAKHIRTDKSEKEIILEYEVKI